MEQLLIISLDGVNFSVYSSAILVEQTTTIAAFAMKNMVSSDTIYATYTIVELDGDGTKDNPYSIADLQILNNSGDSAWVAGYISGCANSSGNLIGVDRMKTHCLLRKNGVKNTSDYELNSPQGIEQVENSVCSAVKVLRSGEIVIVRNNEHYNIHGQRIQ